MKGNVLVVDDEKVVLKSCERILAPEGYDVETTSSAVQGLSKLREKDYDVVITDMKMPEMDGLEFIRQLREHSPDQDVILITGYPSQGSIKEALRMNIVDYLPKPFSPALLLDITNKAFEIKKKGAAPPSENGDYTEEVVRKLDETILMYSKRPGAGGLIPVLMDAQEIVGYLPPVVLRHIARGLNLSVSEVHGVVSFYSYFSVKPKGRNRIKICLGTACYVKRANEIIKRLNEVLGIDMDEVTDDREFSMESVNCLGACSIAPVVVVGKDSYGSVEPAEADKILDNYR
jgi:NADH-quinone oxidoreductase subunit E